MADYEEGYVIIERRVGNFGTFVWGLLVGAAAALLFAPKSGRETRAELSESYDRMRDDTETRVREIQNSVNATVDDVRRQFEDGVESARRAVESSREAARASRDEIERRMQESREAFRTGFEAAQASGSDQGDGAGSGTAEA